MKHFSSCRPPGSWSREELSRWRAGIGNESPAGGAATDVADFGGLCDTSGAARGWP